MTVTQNAPILHPPGGEENHLVFVLTVTVTDADGDTASGTITITVNDDFAGYQPRGRISADAAGRRNQSRSKCVWRLFGIVQRRFWCGRPWIGRLWSEHGQRHRQRPRRCRDRTAILLFNVRRRGRRPRRRRWRVPLATPFTVSVDCGTGVVTLDQIRALEHPDRADPNDAGQPERDFDPDRPGRSSTPTATLSAWRSISATV